MHVEEVARAFDQKVRRGMFRPVARHVLHHPDPEDRLQDAIAQTWEMYARYAERGVVLDDAILVHSCRQRAVDLARHFVPSDGTRRYHDVCDQRAYRDGKVEVFRLDWPFEDEDGDEGSLQPVGYAEEQCPSPERKLNSALDLENWLDGLTARDRSIMEGRMAGYGLPRIAVDLGLSTSTIFAKTKALGLELAHRAGVRVDLDKTRNGHTRQRMLDAE